MKGASGKVYWTAVVKRTQYLMYLQITFIYRVFTIYKNCNVLQISYFLWLNPFAEKSRYIRIEKVAVECGGWSYGYTCIDKKNH